MKAAVVTFPGSNCDRDLAVAFESAGFQVARVWHKDTELPGRRCGGHSGRVLVWRLPALRGDCGAVADQGGGGAPMPTRRLCAGHLQRLSGADRDGAAAGALMRNAGLKFICRTVTLPWRPRTAPLPQAMCWASMSRADRPSRRQLHGRRRGAEAAAGRGPHCLTYARTRTGSMARHCRRAVGKPPGVGDDAASRAGNGPGAGVARTGRPCSASIMGGMALA
jgi:phosphoribosylformylglycinamidine synthase subunit PurQ / glutaminase